MMRTDTYWDLPELNNIPMPFTAEEVLLDSDFHLQDGHQPAGEVFKKATNIVWTTNADAPNLQIGFLKNKQMSYALKEWSKNLFPKDFFDESSYERPISTFPATFIRTNASDTSRWHYEGYYPWIKPDDSSIVADDSAGGSAKQGRNRQSCVLNFKLAGSNDSDLVFGRPNNYVVNTIKRLYLARTQKEDLQWCENKNIRSNFYSDAIMTIDKNVTEIDRKVNYDCPFLLNLGHIDTHPNPWHRVENSRATVPRISLRMMCNRKYPMKHWVDLHKQGKFLGVANKPRWDGNT